MLAKPEYSSPPDEVCCWQGRRGGAAAGRAELESWLSWKAGLAGKQAGPESGLGRKAGWAGSGSWLGRKAGWAGPESWLGRNRLECDIDAYAVAHALAVIDIGAGKAGQVAVIGRSVLGYLVVEGLHPRGVESELLAYLV